MSISERVTSRELAIWSEMVATFYLLTGRDPRDDEAKSLVETARLLAAEQPD